MRKKEELNHTTATIKLLKNELNKDKLNAIEQAHLFANLLDQLNINQLQLAKRLSIHKQRVNEKLQLLRLPDDIQQMIVDGKLDWVRAVKIIRSNNKQQLIEQLRAGRQPPTRQELMTTYKGWRLLFSSSLQRKKPSETQLKFLVKECDELKIYGRNRK